MYVPLWLVLVYIGLMFLVLGTAFWILHNAKNQIITLSNIIYDLKTDYKRWADSI